IESFLRNENLIIDGDSLFKIVQHIKDSNENEPFFANLQTEINASKNYILETFSIVHFGSASSQDIFERLIKCLNMLIFNDDRCDFYLCSKTLINFLHKNFKDFLSNKNTSYDVLSRKIIVNNIDILLKKQNLKKSIRKIYNLKLEDIISHSSRIVKHFDLFLAKPITKEDDLFHETELFLDCLLDNHKTFRKSPHYRFLREKKNIVTIVNGFVKISYATISKDIFKSLNVEHIKDKSFQLCLLLEKGFADKLLENLKNQKKIHFYDVESIDEAITHDDHIQTVFYQEWDDKFDRNKIMKKRND
ncbi:hypothetical protein EDEG_04212, partial [Edhazardia aedis USNM 41457]